MTFRRRPRQNCDTNAPPYGHEYVLVIGITELTGLTKREEKWVRNLTPPVPEFGTSTQSSP
jgi:hypothetical protein